MSETTQKDAAGFTSNLRHDLLSSVVVFLVALPLCMGIAIASGTPVATGLITGIVGGLVVGVLAGSPFQVSGPAAGLTVIVFETVQRFGLEMLGLVVLVAGLLQLLAGALRLGPWDARACKCAPGRAHSILPWRCAANVACYSWMFSKPNATSLEPLI